MDVCGSSVLFYGHLVPRRPFGRMWLRRPLLCVFVSPSPLFGVLGQRPHLWTLMAPSSSFMGGFLLPLSGCEKNPNDANSPREHSGATDSAAALPIPD